MLNNTIYSPTQKVSVNSVSGTLTKTCKDSFFISCHINSELAKYIFLSSPKYHEKEVVVLQIMLASNDWIITELIYSNDFEKLEVKKNQCSKNITC